MPQQVTVIIGEHHLQSTSESSRTKTIAVSEVRGIFKHSLIKYFTTTKWNSFLQNQNFVNIVIWLGFSYC